MYYRTLGIIYWQWRGLVVRLGQSRKTQGLYFGKSYKHPLRLEPWRFVKYMHINLKTCFLYKKGCITLLNQFMSLKQSPGRLILLPSSRLHSPLCQTAGTRLGAPLQRFVPFQVHPTHTQGLYCARAKYFTVIRSAGRDICILVNLTWMSALENVGLFELQLFVACSVLSYSFRNTILILCFSC